MRFIVIAILSLTPIMVIGQDDSSHESSWNNVSCSDFYSIGNPFEFKIDFTDYPTLEYIKKSGKRFLVKSWNTSGTNREECVFFDSLGLIESVVNLYIGGSRSVIRYEYTSDGRICGRDVTRYMKSGIMGQKHKLYFSKSGVLDSSKMLILNWPYFSQKQDMYEVLFNVVYDTVIDDLTRYSIKDTFGNHHYYWLRNDSLVLRESGSFKDHVKIVKGDSTYALKYFRTENDTTKLMGTDIYDYFDQLIISEAVNTKNEQMSFVLEENRYNGFKQMLTHQKFCDKGDIITYIRDNDTGAIIKEIVKSYLYGEYEISYTYY